MKNAFLLLSILVMVNACSSSEPGTEEAKEGVSDSDFVEGSDSKPDTTGDTLSANEGGDSDLQELGDLEGVDEKKAADADASPQDSQPPTNELSNAQPVTAPVAEAPVSTGTYTVARGDTLMKIAYKTTGDVGAWHQIYEMNKDQVSNPNLISVGQNLKINPNGFVDNRSGSPYEIKKGDTLASISNQLYGTINKWKELYQNNQALIKNPNRIFAGFTLFYSPMNQLSGNDNNSPAPASVSTEPSAPAAAPAPQSKNTNSKDSLPSEGVNLPNPGNAKGQ